MNVSDPIITIISAAYYILAGILTLFSIFSIYVLLRYARSRVLALVICLIYSGLFLTFLGQSHYLLQTLQ